MTYPMHPHTPQTHRSFFRISPKSTLKLLAIFLLVAVVPLALYVRVKSEAGVFKSVALKNDPKRVTVQAAGRGKPYLNLQDGRKASVEYRRSRADQRFAKWCCASAGIGFSGF